MKKLLIILLIIGGLIMLRPINEIIRNTVGNIIHRGFVVTGEVAVDNGDGSYDVFIAEEAKAYPKVYTLARNPDLVVGDKVRILYKNGCKELPIILPPVKPTELIKLFESYFAPDAQLFNYSYGDIWRGQTFLTESAHTINYIELLLARRYSNSVPGTIYIEIKEANENDIPINDILTSGETNGDTLPYAIDNPDVNREWRKVDLTEYNLKANTKYAIILHIIGGTSIHSAGIWAKMNGEPYPDGKLLYSTNGGSSWLAQSLRDCGFKIYGKAL